jgi:hypothetical protein
LNPHSNTFSLIRQVQEFSATRLHVGSQKRPHEALSVMYNFKN